MRLAILPCLLLLGCSDANEENLLRGQLSAALTEAASASGDAGVLVYVDGSRFQTPYSATRPGVDGREIAPNAVMRIASNTKTFVAVAALRLAERGQLDLDAPISETLPSDLQTLLRDGSYDVEEITASMLLQHSSGLADHAQLQSYFEAIMAAPDRVWTSEEQIKLAMREGERVGSPGEVFAYSDTGYILMAEIIQAVHGAPLADAMTELSGIEDFPLDATWWEDLQPAPASAPVPLAQTAFGLSLWDISASVDLYGGGGLISNLPDLAGFHRAAVRGQLFDTPEAREVFRTPSPQSLAQEGPAYAMGLFVRQIEGETCYTHSGFWGTLAIHCPDIDVTVAAAVTDAEGFGALYPLARAAVRAAR